MKSISVIAASVFFAAAAQAQEPIPAPTTTPADTAVKLDVVTVKAAPIRTTVTKLVLPVTASVTAERAKETINIVDPEDVVKYMPSVFLRKRNNGDTQAVMGTRVWGVGGSARSLIFADGVPLTALIANNNTIGSPRWGLVSPEEIERIDMMYGPFSAAYAGNSMGAVMEITTRLPERFVGSINQTQALQSFKLYGTRDTYSTSQTGARIGDRFGKLAFWLSGTYQNSFSQPLGFVTSSTFPAGTSGGFPGQNKLGAPANVLGASGLLHTRMTNAKVKAAYDITPAVRAAYTLGFWSNDSDASVVPYTTGSGQPTYAGQAGFASGYSHLDERHSSHSLTIRSDTRKDWDFEAVGTLYRFDKDKQRSPSSASATGTTFGTPGRVAVLDGTGWSTLDLKGIWHEGGPADAVHSVSFGAHYDRYKLLNTTFNTSDWSADGPYTSVATEGDGKTRTQALWAQDSWRILPEVRFTFGGRYEQWRAFDGFNVNGNTKVNQPVVSLNRFSPKGSLAWAPTPLWSLTASIGKAYRFPTASELYQLVSTGTTFTSPDPNLKPDNALVTEIRGERRFDRGVVQLALFQDDVHDAIISQFKPLVAGSPTFYSFVSNVDHVRGRGAELALSADRLLNTGFGFSGSVTYLNARVLAISGRASATAPAGNAVGKRLPNIPDWRGTFASTYRPGDRLAFTLAGRYSGMLFTTLDNADVNPNTYQGFSAWFVADARAQYHVDRHWTASIGADNLLNRKYFLFHPFPQRTFLGNLAYSF